jgi:hypothetical protein
MWIGRVSAVRRRACRKEEDSMDMSLVVRVVAAIAFVVVLGILVVRRKRKSA